MFELAKLLCEASSVQWRHRRHSIPLRGRVSLTSLYYDLSVSEIITVFVTGGYCLENIYLLAIFVLWTNPIWASVAASLDPTWRRIKSRCYWGIFHCILFSAYFPVFVALSTEWGFRYFWNAGEWSVVCVPFVWMPWVLCSRHPPSCVPSLCLEVSQFDVWHFHGEIWWLVCIAVLTR